MEKKRLSEVLAHVKDRQDQQRPPRVKTNSEKAGYQRTGRKSPGRRSFVAQLVERRVTEAKPAAPPRAASEQVHTNS